MTVLLVAGLGGCVSPRSNQNVNQNYDQAQARAQYAQQPAVKQASWSTHGAPAGAIDNLKGGIAQAGFRETGFDRGYDPAMYGPRGTGIGMLAGQGGILPAPMQGPQGVVAGVGMMDPSMGGFSPYAAYGQGRSSIKFVAPTSMKINMQDGQGFANAEKVVPFAENMLQGGLYRLRISGIPDRPGKVYYPTLEVYPATQATIGFLAHACVPLGFSNEDFDQVNNGNMVVKVVYLPNAAHQDLAAAQEIVSTTLDPGQDPIAEANRRGTILAVVRLGNIDLENPSTPAMDAPAPGMARTCQRRTAAPTGPPGGGEGDNAAMSFTPGQLLMLGGLVAMAACYFAFVSRRHRLGQAMVAARDKRLSPPNFESLSADERRALYRQHSFAAAWDTTGRILAGGGAWSFLVFIAGLVIEFLGITA